MNYFVISLESMVTQTKSPPRASQCSQRVKLPPENNTQSDSFLRFLDSVETPIKNPALFSWLSPHVELPSEYSFLAIIGKLVESNSQLVDPLDAERLTNAELALEDGKTQN